MPLKVARLRISEYNDNRKRQLKNQERKIQMVSLSLTSMVDMFAIMVIFLLANSSSVSQWVEVANRIDVPKAKAAAKEAPKHAATLQISTDSIYGGRDKLVEVNKAMAQGMTIEAVKKYLTAQKSDSSLQPGYVNVVAHEKLPFSVIKKVMLTAQVAGFPNVNLVVQPQ